MKEAFKILNLFLWKNSFSLLDLFMFICTATWTMSHTSNLLCLAPQGTLSLWVENPGPTQDLCCCNLLPDKLEGQSSDLFSPWLGKGKLHLIKPVLKKGMLSNLYCSGAPNPGGGLIHRKACFRKSHHTPQQHTPVGICWLSFNKASSERMRISNSE